MTTKYIFATSASRKQFYNSIAMRPNITVMPWEKGKNREMSVTAHTPEAQAFVDMHYAQWGNH